MLNVTAVVVGVLMVSFAAALVFVPAGLVVVGGALVLAGLLWDVGP